MATLDAASIELAESMSIDAVPTKLRCGSCNKLAVNAVKLPCCDQSICEPCSQDLPDTCPICGHSPLSSEDCKPNKSLRMTVKAFIKNEEKKRSKEAEANAPKPVEVATPIKAAEPDTPVPGLASEASASVATPEVPNGESKVTTLDGDGGDDRPTSARSASRDMPSTLQGAPGDVTVEDEEEDDEDDVVITTERPDHEYEQQTAHTNEEHHQDQVDQTQFQEREQTNEKQGFGFDQNQGFGNMDFGNMNNFNPMMAMQNGMGMPGFGMMPNMMGIPGMNMDPSMMFGGGFGGMGGMNNMDMSMMNMGMGMNGMGNFGGMPGMGMNGGGGGGGPNFFPPNGGGGGYNQQQNFGSHMNQNFHHNRGYGNRPYNNRGFGRGGRGYHNRGRGGGNNWQNYGQFNDHRGGQNQNYNSPPVNQQYQQQQNFRGNDESFDSTSAQQGATRGSPSYEPMNAPDVVESDQPKLSVDAEGTHDTKRELVNATNQTDVAADGDGDGSAEAVSQLPEDAISKGDLDKLQSEDVTAAHAEHAEDAESANVNDPAQPNQIDVEQQHDPDSAFVGRGGFRGARGNSRGRGGAYGYVSTPMEPEPVQAAPVAPPVNAPTGPKAMRAGLPNSGWYSRPQNATAAPAASPSEREMPVRTKSGSRVRSQSRSRSVSRHGDHKDWSRNHDDERESDGTYERRKDRERRRRKERDDTEANGDGSEKKTRSRSESRDDDRSKRRHRDKEDEHRSSRSHRDRSRDRRKHRHRSRSPEKDASVNGDYESGRRKSKSDRKRDEEYEESDRARNKGRKHSRRDDDYEEKSKDRSNESSRHGRSSKEDRDRREKRHSVIEEPEEEFEFKIKGKSASMKQGLDTSMGPPTTFGRERSENRASATKVSTPVTPSTPVDPYAADRENHRKKREAEQQKRLEGRRQSSQSLGKHSRGEEEEVEAPTGPKGDSGRGGKRARKDHRRHSLKYEGEVDGYDERDNRRWR